MDGAVHRAAERLACLDSLIEEPAPARLLLNVPIGRLLVPADMPPKNRLVVRRRFPDRSPCRARSCRTAPRRIANNVRLNVALTSPAGDSSDTWQSRGHSAPSWSSNGDLQRSAAPSPWETVAASRSDPGPKPRRLSLADAHVLYWRYDQDSSFLQRPPGSEPSPETLGSLCLRAFPGEQRCPIPPLVERCLVFSLRPLGKRARSEVVGHCSAE